MKQVTLLGQNNRTRKPETSFIYTIHNLAKDLKNHIAAKQAEAFQIGQKLDNSFPKRILEPISKLTQEEFDKLAQELTLKQRQLQEYGVTISTAEIPKFDNEKSDVLSVYLEDSKKKIAVFDDLLAKINLFVSTLNNKQFANKTIKINGNIGFFVMTREGKTIDLSLLSSGEQQEIVLLYELLFKTNPGTLVFIDEPEISLHVMWQKEFVKDLLEIAKLKNISFCLATHSPQIINGRWDLVTDLYTLANKKGNPDFEENDVK
jgi:predicted ATP-binding protein involved in virulence